MNFTESLIKFFLLFGKKFIVLAFLIFSQNSLALGTFELSEKLRNSTVRINIWENYGNEYMKDVFSGGSGIVLNKYRDTYFILTNAHVVLERFCLVEQYLETDCEDDYLDDSLTIVIDTPDSSFEYPISNEDFIYWEDLDLAVIAIEGSIDETENFQVLEIGGIWHPLQQVYSVGFPFVLGNNKNYRDIFYDSCVVNAGILDEEGLIETSNYSIVHDCAISGGMSGGPLVSEDGKLIAVNGLKGVEILEQGWSGQITYTDFDNLNHAYGIHIYDLYVAALNTESGNFDPRSKFYNFLPRLSLDEHKSFYDFLLNEEGGSMSKRTSLNKLNKIFE